jgi:hypothetical protein
MRTRVMQSDTRHMLTADTVIPEYLAQQSILVVECTIPADLTIREWRRSRGGQCPRTRRQAIRSFSRS